MTVSLTDFLLARLAEEEADLPSEVAESHYQTWHAADWYRANVVAKRAIAEEHGELCWSQPTGWCRTCAENEWPDYDGAPKVPWPCPTLRSLAAIYADHPDYRKEWRP